MAYCTVYGCYKKAKRLVNIENGLIQHGFCKKHYKKFLYDYWFHIDFLLQVPESIIKRFKGTSTNKIKKVVD